MKIKVEKVALPEATYARSIGPFVEAARDLKVGESFVFDGLTSNHRNALSILQYAYGRRYAVRKTRVFRVE